MKCTIAMRVEVGPEPGVREVARIASRGEARRHDGARVGREELGSPGRPWAALATLGVVALVGCGDAPAKQGPVIGTAAALAAGSYWKQVSTTPRVESSALTYDSARKRIWHFELDMSPSTTAINTGRMWDWDGTTWTLRAETGAPGTSGPGPGNVFAVMTYDSLRDRVVLLGHGAESETWLWNGTSWTLATSLTVSPPPRDFAAITYDSGRGEVLVFGGVPMLSPASNLNDTWAWNGSSWTQRTATGPAPPGGRGVQMAYDAARARTVLLTAGSTWEWDGMVWQQRAPATDPLLTGTLTYDAALGTVVLFGGRGGTNQVWQWDGSTWTERPSATTTPAVKEIAYDSARDKLVLFTSDASTWEWDGVNWAARVRSPPVQAQPAMAYDRARQEVVLFAANVMWAWNGSIWQPKAFTGPGPVPNPGSRTVMAYDAVREKVVLFNGQTWEWDGTTWEQRLTSGDAPVIGTAMTYDGARRTMLLLAVAVPSSDGEMWAWDGTTWTKLSPNIVPQPVTNDVMAYDSARERVVLFTSLGRHSLSGETWEWDGSSWTQRAVGDPASQTLPGIAYDVVRGKIVLVGNGTWEWDGTTWTQFAGASEPPGRNETALAYDNVRQTLVLFGGANRSLGLSPYGDTWERRGWTACTSSAQCTTGTCVDGVCCDTTASSCGVCRACNVAGWEGVCAPTTGSCDDGNACTRVDTCQAGQCVGSESVSCAPQGECRLAGTCDPATGVCSNPPVADGTPCSGGVCPTPPANGGQCLGNMCVSGECRQSDLCLGVTCSAADACHLPGVCDPATGACSSPAMPDGKACDDGNPRTRFDSCHAGTCVGTGQPPPPRGYWFWWHRVWHRR